MSLEYDEAVCSNEDCLHRSPPNRDEVLYAEAANVASGFLDIAYAHGLPEEDLDTFHAMGNRVSQVTVRLDCVEPQTGMKVQMTFVMPTSMAHHLGVEMIGASFHHSSSADDYWSPVQAQPDEDGVQVAAEFYQTLEGDGDGGDT